MAGLLLLAAYTGGQTDRGGAHRHQRAANFRLDSPGLDCTRVTKIDSFTVKQTFPSVNGDVREPGPLSFPNLTVTLSDQSAQTWQSWLNNFVIEGTTPTARRRPGG